MVLIYLNENVLFRCYSSYYITVSHGVSTEWGNSKYGYHSEKHSVCVCGCVCGCEICSIYKH